MKIIYSKNIFNALIQYHISLTTETSDDVDVRNVIAKTWSFQEFIYTDFVWFTDYSEKVPQLILSAGQHRQQILIKMWKIQSEAVTVKIHADSDQEMMSESTEKICFSICSHLNLTQLKSDILIRCCSELLICMMRAD